MAKLILKNNQYIISGELLLLIQALIELYKENLEVDAEQRGIIIRRMYQVYIREDFEEVN